MKKVLIIVAILSLALTFSTPAVALMDDNGNSHNCQGNACNDNSGTIIIGDGNVTGDGNGNDVNVGSGNDVNIGNDNDVSVTGGTVGDTVGGDVNVEGDTNTNDNSANNSNENSQETNVTFNEAENKRNLTGPPVLSGVVPSGAAFNENATPTGNVQKLQNVLIFKATFTYRQLKALKGTSTHPWSERAKVRAKYFDAKKKNYYDMNDDMTITAVLAVVDKDGNVTRPAGDYRPVVHITVEGKSSTTTVSAFARTAIAALKAGSDRVVITGEGAKRIMEAGGFGLMLGSSVMTISESGQKATGTATVGGLGFASSWASYGYSPWLQGMGIITE